MMFALLTVGKHLGVLLLIVVISGKTLQCSDSKYIKFINTPSHISDSRVPNLRCLGCHLQWFLAQIHVTKLIFIKFSGANITGITLLRRLAIWTFILQFNVLNYACIMWTWILHCFVSSNKNAILFSFSGIKPYLIIGNRYYIRKMDLDGSNFGYISNHHEYTHVLDFDYHVSTQVTQYFSRGYNREKFFEAQNGIFWGFVWTEKITCESWSHRYMHESYRFESDPTLFTQHLFLILTLIRLIKPSLILLLFLLQDKVIYLVDAAKRQIIKMHFNGTEIGPTLITSSYAESIEGIAVDWIGKSVPQNKFLYLLYLCVHIDVCLVCLRTGSCIGPVGSSKVCMCLKWMEPPCMS